MKNDCLLRGKGIRDLYLSEHSLNTALTPWAFYVNTVVLMFLQTTAS